MLNSALTVAGELLLDSNTATFGAGIALDDICLVCAKTSLQILFHGMEQHTYILTSYKYIKQLNKLKKQVGMVGLSSTQTRIAS